MAIDKKTYLDYQGLAEYDSLIKEYIRNKIHEIPPVEQSNWSENDESSSAFIKNRTHYEENGLNEILNSSVIFGYPSNDFMNGEKEPPFEPGTDDKTISENYFYNVTVDNQPTRKLKLTSCVDKPNTKYLGNSELAPMVAEAVNTDLNFCLLLRHEATMSNNDANVTFFSTELGEHTITIEKTNEPCVDLFYQTELYDNVPEVYSAATITVEVNGVEKVLTGQEVVVNNGNTNIPLRLYGNAKDICNLFGSFLSVDIDYDKTIDADETICFLAPCMLIPDGWYVTSKSNEVTSIHFKNYGVSTLTTEDWMSSAVEPSNVLDSWTHTYNCQNYELYKSIYLSKEDEPFVQPDHTYEIIVNGNTYELPAVSIDINEKVDLYYYKYKDSMYNTMLLGDENRQDPPFYIVTYSTQKYDYYQSVTHDIYNAELRINPSLRGQKLSYILGEKGEIVHKLDKKYLPEDTLYGKKANSINFVDTGFTTSTQVYNFTQNVLANALKYYMNLGTGTADSADDLQNNYEDSGDVMLIGKSFEYGDTMAEPGDFAIKTKWYGWKIVSGKQYLRRISEDEISQIFAQ